MPSSKKAENMILTSPERHKATKPSTEVCMRVMLCGVLGLAVLVGGCSRSRIVQSKAAVQEGIERYLRKQSNVLLDNMTVEVKDVQIAGDRATADVNFRSKQSPDLVMGRRYILRQVGAEWQVESSSSPGGMGGPHGGPAMPQPQTPAASPVTPQPSH